MGSGKSFTFLSHNLGFNSDIVDINGSNIIAPASK